jgi:short-subunit dehydrogenase
LPPGVKNSGRQNALNDSMDTSKAVALITGASSGIGEVFARKLAARGCRVVLVARRRERLETLASELPDAEIIAADLTVDSDIEKVEQYISAQSRLEFLVNNAGFGVPGSYYGSEADAQDRMHRLHIIAASRLTHAALRGMVERAKGNIINVSSVAGFLQAPFSVSYNATKAWMNSFTTGLYIELKSIHSPVRVQALCPGFTVTEFHDTLGMDRKSIPRSLWLSADEVVNDSLRGLERGKLFVIPGWRYRLFLAVAGILPRSFKRFLAIKLSRPPVR